MVCLGNMCMDTLHKGDNDDDDDDNNNNNNDNYIAAVEDPWNRVYPWREETPLPVVLTHLGMWISSRWGRSFTQLHQRVPKSSGRSSSHSTPRVLKNQLPGFRHQNVADFSRTNNTPCHFHHFLYYSLNTKTHRLKGVSSRQGYTLLHGSSKAAIRWYKTFIIVLLQLNQKVKVKAVCGSYSTDALRHIVLLPECIPSFISRGAAHTPRGVRDLC